MQRVGRHCDSAFRSDQLLQDLDEAEWLPFEIVELIPRRVHEHRHTGLNTDLLQSFAEIVAVISWILSGQYSLLDEAADPSPKLRGLGYIKPA